MTKLYAVAKGEMLADAPLELVAEDKLPTEADVLPPAPQNNNPKESRVSLQPPTFTAPMIYYPYPPNSNMAAPPGSTVPMEYYSTSNLAMQAPSSTVPTNNNVIPAITNSVTAPPNSTVPINSDPSPSGAFNMDAMLSLIRQVFQQEMAKLPSPSAAVSTDDKKKKFFSRK